MTVRTLSLAAIACALVACADTTAPTAPKATVTVTAQSVVATTVSADGVTWIRFTVPVQIENRGTVPLSFAYCASRIEARDADAWAGAWFPSCAAIEVVPLAIAAGERRDITVNVNAALDGPGGPAWHAGPTGADYRFVAGLVPPGTSGDIPTLPSNSFMLTVVD